MLLWWPPKAGFIFLVHTILSGEDQYPHGCFIQYSDVYNTYLSWPPSLTTSCLFSQYVYGAGEDDRHLSYDGTCL